MPLDVETAAKAKRAVGRSLMPLSFATILGGMITLIGTPPNIVIAEYRQDALGESFGMFDFAPVGLAVAIAGIAFVSLIGWRFLPDRTGADRTGPKNSKRAAMSPRSALAKRCWKRRKPCATSIPYADEHDVHILGLVRSGKRLPGFSARQELRASDFLVVEGEPKSIEAFMGKGDMEYAGSEKQPNGVSAGGLTLTEAIVPEGARIDGRTARGLATSLPSFRHASGRVPLSGQRFRDRVRLLTIKPGRCAAASRHTRTQRRRRLLAGRPAA